MLNSSGVKIVATLGPSINNEETIEELIKSGFPIGWREMGTERAVVGQLVAPPLPA